MLHEDPPTGTRPRACCHAFVNPHAVRSTWAGRIADVAAEAAGLRLACPALAAVTAEGASLRLDFLNLATQLKFSVLLVIGAPPPLSAAPNTP